MTLEHRERRRGTFDQAADLYDRARPGYPRALFDDLAELTGVGAGSRVLEIGPGTGQATLPLAERGCRVVAVERLAGHHQHPPHRRRRRVVLRRSPDLLRALGPRDPFRRGRPRARSRHPPRQRRARPVHPVRPRAVRRYEWELPYTTASYLDLLRTYSGHRDLDPGSQAGLLGCIAHLIDSRHGGRIVRRYLTELRVAPAVQPPT
jgi:hypothetical protein